ncbi:MAG: glycerol kinase GlpK [Chloroflexi bacterium]|nr:glycerol kinase GlpK [Chloroflexota bacterium]
MTMILALDQSTSATKALLYNTDGELVDKTALDHQQHYPRPGWVEHDPEEIYANVLQTVQTLLARNPQHAQHLVCLSITNQRETVVVFDKSTGKPLYNAIVWQCRRGEAICDQLIAEGYSPQVQQATGLKIDTYFPAAKLKWLFEQHPEIKQRVDDGTALIGTIDTYLIYRLTDGRCFATDHTNASRTLFYNIQQLKWDAALCDLFDVPLQALPEVRESAAQFGTTTLGGVLDASLPIRGVMGDSQAALFAERCFRPGMAKVTFGTGSSVLLNIGSQPNLSDSGIVTTIGWVYDAKPTYAFEGIINFTGATIAWLRDQLCLITDAAETEVLAQAVPDNGGVYLVPAFVGLSAPYWRPDAKGAIVGLTPAATRSHIARAALEAIAYRVCDVLSLMAREAGVSLEYIHGDGGAVSNRFLMQFVADITRYTLRAARLPELSALGAVMAGMLGSGLAHSLADLEQLPHQFDDYTPEMDAALANEFYAGWQQAVRMTL